MSDDVRSPAQYAAGIDAAMERLAAFAAGCPAEQWRAAPLDGDPRPVGIIVDHVAHAYEYMGGWVRRILAGEDVAVAGTTVDALNAEHAAAAAAVTPDEAIKHLRSSGGAFAALVAGCSAADLQAAGGRVERFAQIGIRHPDEHRAELEAALGI
jgi:DinB superfamily